jgi:hypothetical protein
MCPTSADRCYENLEVMLGTMLPVTYEVYTKDTTGIKESSNEARDEGVRFYRMDICNGRKEKRDPNYIFVLSESRIPMLPCNISHSHPLRI